MKLTNTIKKIKQIEGKTLSLAMIALIINFAGALMLVFSTGALPKDNPGIIFYSGPRALHLNHPTMFRLGLYLICLGFLVQLISEIIDRYSGKR